MKRFADLHLRCTAPETDNLSELLELARRIGYGHVAIEFATGSTTQMKKAMVKCRALGLGMSTRLDLEPSDDGALSTMLGHNAGRYDLVAVRCISKSIARLAAKDPRVDLLQFPPNPRQRKLVNFDSKEAQLAANGSCALEIDFSALLKADELGRARLLSTMRSELSFAQTKHVGVVVTSGAEDAYGLRAPRDLASFLGLLGMDWQMCLDAVSTIPLQLVMRNQRFARGGSKPES